MNNPLQAFVWGCNKRDGIKHLPTITFKGYIRVNTQKYPHTNRKLRFELNLNENGIFTYSRYRIIYDNGTFQVRYADTPNGYMEVPLSDVGNVSVKKFDKLNNVIYYEIECNFTYEVLYGRVIKGIEPDKLILGSFFLTSYTSQHTDKVSLLDDEGSYIEENPRNFYVVGELAERMTVNDNIFGFRAETVEWNPSSLKTIKNLYGVNTISLDYSNV